MDGVGRYFGDSVDSTAFVDDAGSGDPTQGTFTTLSVSGALYTEAFAANNDGEVAVEDGCHLPCDSNWVYYNGNFTPMDQWLTTDNVTFGSLVGINDEAQLLATYSDLGMLAVPQY